MANVEVDGEMVYLGHYKTELEAIIAHNEGVHNYCTNAMLSFITPEKHEELVESYKLRTQDYVDGRVIERGDPEWDYEDECEALWLMENGTEEEKKRGQELLKKLSEEEV